MPCRPLPTLLILILSGLLMVPARGLGWGLDPVEHALYRACGPSVDRPVTAAADRTAVLLSLASPDARSPLVLVEVNGRIVGTLAARLSLDIRHGDRVSIDARRYPDAVVVRVVEAWG